jgi:hypothetical protein
MRDEYGADLAVHGPSSASADRPDWATEQWLCCAGTYSGELSATGGDYGVPREPLAFGLARQRTGAAQEMHDCCSRSARPEKVVRLAFSVSHRPSLSMLMPRPRSSKRLRAPSPPGPPPPLQHRSLYYLHRYITLSLSVKCVASFIRRSPGEETFFRNCQVFLQICKDNKICICIMQADRGEAKSI